MATTSLENSLHSILRVYNEPFFSAGQLDKLIAAIKAGNANETVQKAKLWYPDDDNVDDVLEHFTHRVPIYYGEPMTSGFPSYSDLRLKETFGYDTKEAMAVLSKVPTLTYCYGGPVYDLDYPMKKNAVIHAWGVNLETRETAHYKHFVNDDGTLNEALYQEQSARTLRCILNAAESLGYSRVFLPFLGLGQFLSALSAPQKHCARRGFFNALVQEAASFTTTEMEVRGMPRDLSAVHSVLEEIEFEKICPNVKVVAANIVDVGTEPTLVVNPADNCSFAGNGGCNDPTLDGFIVSGEYLGWRTTAYLHNDVFSQIYHRRDEAVVPVSSWAAVDDDEAPPPPGPLIRSTAAYCPPPAPLTRAFTTCGE